MKKLFIWFVLFQKRILKKPVFLVTLLLIPVLILMLCTFSKTGTSLVSVGLYTTEQEGSSADLVRELTQQHSSGVISFYVCDSKKQLKNDVLKGNAACGYIFPVGLAQILDDYQDGNTASMPFKNGIVKTFVKDNSVAVRVVNELLLSKLFSLSSFKMLNNYLKEQQPEKMSEEDASTIQDRFTYYRQKQFMFSFEYADGSENKLLNNNNNNYYMMPVRGMLSLLILLTSMIGALMLGNDDNKGVWAWIPLKKRPVFHYFYLLCSVFLIALFSLIAILFTGLSTKIVWELAIMLTYVLLTTGFSNLLRVLIKNQYSFCCLIPLVVLCSLVLCPIFINIGDLLTPVHMIQQILPVNYYLESLYSVDYEIKMLLAAILTGLLSLTAEHFSLGFRGKLPRKKPS